MAFLLMCGDVDPNPDPTVSLPCGVCKFEVMDSDKAMCCDLCDKWIHVACDPSIDESVYDDLVLNPTSDLWFCSNCCNPESEPQTSPAHFNCVCMNVRSIISKKLDLLAYVTAHSYDLIAVTGWQYCKFRVFSTLLCCFPPRSKSPWWRSLNTC